MKLSWKMKTTLIAWLAPHPWTLAATAIVTDDEWEVSDTDSDLNHADVDLDGWDGDSEFTWGEGDGETITTAASTAADSLNSEGSSHYEGAHFGERSFDFSEDSPQTERVVDRNEEEKLQSSLSAQLLRLHHRFNHISFRKIKMMAKAGLVDKKLADAPTPVCSACLYGKATRRPWRTKPKLNPKPQALQGDLSRSGGLCGHDALSNSWIDCSNGVDG